MPRWSWRKRHRHGRVGRPPKPIAVAELPITKKLEPTPKREAQPLYLETAEIEALRLIDLEKLSFEEAGRRMRVSRNTVWRLVESGREKLARAVIEGREINIRG